MHRGPRSCVRDVCMCSLYHLQLAGTAFIAHRYTAETDASQHIRDCSDSEVSSHPQYGSSISFTVNDGRGLSSIGDLVHALLLSSSMLPCFILACPSLPIIPDLAFTCMRVH